MPRTETRGPTWTRKDDRKLARVWGEHGIEELARIFKRTPCSIAKRAARNKLGPSLRGTLSLGRFVVESGYARSRICNAAARIGVDLLRSDRMSEKTPRGMHGRRIIVSEEQRVAILAYLAKVPDGVHVWSGRTNKTLRTEWGTGGKPKTCRKCKKTDRAHKAKGLCIGCYKSARHAESK